jgi:glucose-1-phosphate cytidylyltransferase
MAKGAQITYSLGMKIVILAGGFGTRISEETHLKPKPMVEIGGRPILWHIMKSYAAAGHTEFIICCGYKGYVIKEYFANYFMHHCDVTFDMASGSKTIHQSNAEPWKVTVVDTGENTMTGGRLKRVRHHLDGGTFGFTYGDGLSNVNIKELVAFHKHHGRMATLTAVQPPGRFGAIELTGDGVTRFHEKPTGEGAWINGGFFVLEPSVIDGIEGDETIFEKRPLEQLALKGELQAFRHAGVWQPMDTLRDKQLLEDLWARGDAPWKAW